MKKLLAAALSIGMIMAMTACQNSAGGVKTKTEAAKAAEMNTAGAQAAEVPAWTPKGDVTLYCPYSAGGATDLCLRCLAEILSDQLSVNVNVVNKEGGGGVVGTTQFMTEKPDGYSISMISNSQFSTQPFLRNVNYTVDDFIPFIGLNLEPNLLIVPADAPYDTIEEFISYYKENSGEMITYGHSGNGGIGHLTQTFFLSEAGLSNYESVPYSGNSEAITSLLGKHITMCTANYVEATSLLTEGSVKALALIAAERSDKELFKEIPTLKECGISVDLTIFKFLALPAETPDAIVNFWHDAVTEAYKDSRWTDFAKNTNLDEIGDWDNQMIMDTLLPEIESTHELLKEVGLAVN